MARGSSFYGVNILGLWLNASAQERLLAYLRQLKPSMVVVIEGYALAVRIADALPDCKVVVRPVWVHGRYDNLWQDVDPHQFVQRYADLIRKRDNMLLYSDNEPRWSLQSLIWQIAVSDEAWRLGVKVVLGNWSMGVPEPDQIKLAHGLFERMIQRPGQWIGVHEYFVNRVDNSDYFIGRCLRMVDYCRSAFSADLPILITETQGDYVWREGLKVGGPFAALGLSARQAWSEMQKAHQIHYAGSPVQGSAIYCWGSDDRWREYDIKGWIELQELMVSEPVVAAAQNDQVSYRRNFRARVEHDIAGSLRVRRGPGLTYPVVDSITSGDEVDVVAENTVADGGYLWTELAGGRWIASARPGYPWSVRLVEVKPQPEPEPAPKPEPAPVIDWRERLSEQQRRLLDGAGQAVVSDSVQMLLDNKTVSLCSLVQVMAALLDGRTADS